MSDIKDYIQVPDGSWHLKRQPSQQNPAGIVVARPTSNLVDDIVIFLVRFVVLSEAQSNAIALWVVHSYAIEQADTTPYLNIYSAEKRSGKTRLLETLELLVANPWLTGRVTSAVLARKVDAECPTLLLDESDAAFKSDKEYAENLRGLLNSGYRRGGSYSVCVGQGSKMTYRDFSTFCPKAIAGIGKLPDTVADRSIPIMLRRRTPEETVERFRRKLVEIEALPIREAIAEWVGKLPENVEPEIPVELDDRAADCWEPLLIIADAAGGNWPKKARKAAIELMNGESRHDESLGIVLLEDMREIFKEREQVPSFELVESLIAKEEAPWGELNGRPINNRRLAAMLKPYNIRPHTIRIGEDTMKGYSSADFLDAWKRYLPSNSVNLSVTAVTPGTTQPQLNKPIYPSQITPKEANVTDSCQARTTLDVTHVTDKSQGISETQTKWRIEI